MVWEGKKLFLQQRTIEMGMKEIQGNRPCIWKICSAENDNDVIPAAPKYLLPYFNSLGSSRSCKMVSARLPFPARSHVNHNLTYITNGMMGFSRLLAYWSRCGAQISEPESLLLQCISLLGDRENMATPETSASVLGNAGGQVQNWMT